VKTVPELRGAVETRVRSLQGSKFSECASLEAISAHQKDTEEAQRMLGRHMAWLQDVKIARKAARASSETPRGEG
jgi:hypothetical protein